jgi:hypothetical protein
MKRKEDWPEILAAYLHERRTMPFVWGSNDCCLFSADAILAMTGIDTMADYRGKYNSALSAVRLFKAGGGIEACAAASCKASSFDERANINFAQRGDLVLWDTPTHGPAFGICVGVYSAFASTNGTIEITTAQCRRAWSTV